MSEPKPNKTKLTFWETIARRFRPVSSPVGHVKPYRWRFVVASTLGFAFGALNSLLPVVVASRYRILSFTALTAEQNRHFSKTSGTAR